MKADAEWNAGDLGCGELVFELKIRMAALPPKSILKVTAEDPGAVEDLPAWCGMTGHTLREQQPPHFWIERRED